MVLIGKIGSLSLYRSRRTPFSIQANAKRLQYDILIIVSYKCLIMAINLSRSHQLDFIPISAVLH